MNRRGFLRAVGAAGAWLLLACTAAAAPVRSTPAGRLAQAIRERRVVSFRYLGLRRDVEPHALGLSRAGRAVLLGWQAGGSSRSEPPPGWRTFHLGDVRRLRLLKRTFTPRPDYVREKTGLGAVSDDVFTRAPTNPPVADRD